MPEGFIRRVIEHAALSGAFVPARFRYFTPAERRPRPEETDAERDARLAALWSLALRRLAPLCIERATGRQLRWVMRNPERSEVLRRLVSNPADLAARWRRRPPLRDDAFGQALRLCLGDGPLDGIAFEADSRRPALAAAVFALPLVDAGRRPAIQAFEAALHRAAVAEDADTRQQAALPDRFVGRQAERAAVLAFLEDGSLHPPAVSGAHPEEPVTARLLLTGSEGIGKTAFLADLGTHLPEIVAAAPTWLVRLDFDAATLARGGVVGWTEEVSRQIAAQDGSIAQRLSDLRSRQARHRREAGWDDPETAAHLLMGAINRLLATRPRRRLLILAEHAEALIAQDDPLRFDLAPADSLLHRFLRWTDELAAGLAATSSRALIAAAAPPPVEEAVAERWFTGRLALGALDAAAAADLVRMRAPDLADLAERMVATAGGHPRCLFLLADRLAGLDPDARPSLLDALAAERLPALDPPRALARMTTRFLAQLPARDLPAGLTEAEFRRLARAALVLPEVTPELIADVVGPALGLRLQRTTGATRALRGLAREAWLWQPADRPLTFRPDEVLRQAVLPGLAADDGDGAAVLARAAAWHEARGSDDDTAAALVYRALLGDIPALRDRPQDAARALTQAGSDVAAMPPAARAILKLRAPGGRTLGADELAALPEHLRAEAELARQGQAIRDFGGALPAEEGAAWNPAGSSPAAPALQPLETCDAYRILNDTRLDAAVAVAFLRADFEAAAATGLAALAQVRRWPDLHRPFGLRHAFEKSWLWRTALAALCAPETAATVRLPGLSEAIAGAHEAERPPPSPGAAVFQLEALLAMARAPGDMPSQAEFEGSPLLTDGIGDFAALRLLASAPSLRQALPRALDRLQWPAITGAYPLLAEPALACLFAGALDASAGEGPAGAARARDFLGLLVATLEPEQAAGRGDLMRAIDEGLDVLALTALPSVGLGPLAQDAQRTGLPVLLRGQTPELHGTLATSLLRLPATELLAALDRLAETLPVWPESLHRRLLDSLDSGARARAPLLRRLLRLVDLCGHLTALSAALSEQTDAADLAAVTRLLRRLDSLWCPPPGPDDPSAIPVAAAATRR